MSENTEDTSQPEHDALAEAEAIINGAAEAEAEALTDAAELSPIEAAEATTAEHLADLQRVQAEYVNYRKRVERDRAQAGEHATGKAIEALIPVLDDVAAAREHEELEGPFLAIVDKLESALGRLGWVGYGVAGDSFDPTIHEALMSVPPEEGEKVKHATIKQVAQPGHKYGDKVLRPARVIVTDPDA